MPTPFADCGGLCLAGGNDRERIIAMPKAENMVMCFALFFASCKYGHSERFFVYAQLAAHKGGVIVPFQASVMEEANTVELARLLKVCDSEPVMSFLVFKQSNEID